MNFVLQPWQLFVVILASWINRQQQQRIDYLETQFAVLMEYVGDKRILLTDDQRRRLAVKGKVLGRKQLAQVGTLFTPDTILRWHRQLVAQKWDYSDRKEKKPGRPRIRQVIVDLVVRFAKDNPTWGFGRISTQNPTSSDDATSVFTDLNVHSTFFTPRLQSNGISTETLGSLSETLESMQP